jgi:hypothetical protein
MALGLRGVYGVGAPPFTKGPYTWDQNVTFTAGIAGANTNKNVLYVDGTNGSDGNTGKGWSSAKATIQGAIDAAVAGDIIFIAPKAMSAGDTDPSSYAETLTIAAAKSSLSLIGLSRGRTQGGLPQIKKGSGTTAMLTIRAPGCLIANLGFNGVGASPTFYQSLVGILLDDDASTKTAFGTTIMNCHFKNCAGSAASTNAAEGGAITWSLGGAWQTRIIGCRFYKNVGDIVVVGTSTSVPQDVIIEDCVMSGPAANVDCNIYVASSGVNGIIIRNCSFGQLPALGGTNDRYIKMASGTVGMIEGCTFGCQTSGTGGTMLTFKSGGTAGDFPTTVHIAKCFGQSITADATGGEISIA